MLVDLDHNKIISDTATQGFRASFNNKLLPLLSEKYGDSLKGVQMYEDYIADGFSEGDVWFYPLTLIFDGSYETQWIKWSYSQNDFKNGIPYSYIGDGEIDFELADTVPQQFTDAILGRNTYCAGGGIPITVSAATDDPTFLCGKYSQTFIDMMSEKITEEITKAMSVSGIENSTLELSLVFAPDTYMEHTSENVTYRRLLISDKSCGARDFG